LLQPWEQDVLQLRAQGLSWLGTAREMQKKHPELQSLTETQALGKCRGAVEKSKRPIHNKPLETRPAAAAALPAQAVPLQDVLMAALAKGGDINGLAKRLGTSERVAEAMIQDAKEKGYNVQEKAGGFKLSKVAPLAENRVREAWNGEKVIRFGLMGDTQLGCIDTQITHLHTLYDFYQREGLSKVYNTGDVTDGEKMRPGHEYELYMHGADAQVAHAVKVYPQRPGMMTEFITGNHDYSFIKTIGLDIGKQIAAQRPDMRYLGYGSAVIDLSPKCTLELRHPEDGTAYALSYKIQKIIEAMSGGEKPNIEAVGHYHKHEYLFYRNVHAFQTACLCAQTRFMRGKSIAAAMGGWLIEAHVDDEGTITRIIPEFFPFYKAIKDDYKSWL
jgi:biotin operon repressor